MICKHLGVVLTGVTCLSSSPTCIACQAQAVSPCSVNMFILSTESDLGGMGGRSTGWYFLGKGGLLAMDSVGPLSGTVSVTDGLLNGLCVLLMVENV